MLYQQWFAQNGLSERQVDVASEVVKGLTNKEIGDLLFITEKSVKHHMTNIYKVLNFKNRKELLCVINNMTNLTHRESIPVKINYNPNILPSGINTISSND